jgi:hypothetical protein
MNKEYIIYLVVFFIVLLNIGFLFFIYKYNNNVKVLTNLDIDYDNDIKEESYIVPDIHIKESKLGGRGIFSNKNYKKDDVIEICPAILSNKKNLYGRIRDYIFSHNKDKDKCLIAFGYISIYNHQDDPNCKWEVINDKQIKLTALKDINENDEITVSYGDGYWNSRNYNKK